MAKEIDISAARGVALELLRTVLTTRKPLDDALAVHDGLKKLSQRDRGFARLILATTLRRLGQLDAVIAQCVDKPLPKSGETTQDILRLAATEILFLGVAHHAAVDSAVTLAAARKQTKFKGLVNAVLRRLTREGRDLLAGVPVAACFPAWMYDAWVEAYGADAAQAIGEASLREPPLDITVLGDVEEWARKLSATRLSGSTVRRAFDGAVTDLPGYSAGAWWVQDVAAALPARLLGDVAGKRVVDLCAAPGGKTAQLAAAGATVTAVDRSEVRLKRLERNLSRLGLTAGVVVADGTKWRPEQPADAVLVDAPCSATGTIRRHPDILHAKSAPDVALLSGIQRDLLTAAIDMTAPGGTIVFCTCSLQPEEGAAVVDAVLSADAPAVRAPISAAETDGFGDAVTEAGDVRTLPSHLEAKGGTDGFFVARLTRR